MPTDDAAAKKDILLKGIGLRKYFSVAGGLRGRQRKLVKAVDGVDIAAVSYTHLTLPTTPYV